jgi:PAS domain S-box-containing protein
MGRDLKEGRRLAITIRRLLALLVTAAVIPLLLLSGALLVRLADSENIRVEQQALQIAQRTALALDRDLASIDFGLRALAAAAAADDPHILDRQVREMERVTGTRIRFLPGPVWDGPRVSNLTPGLQGWSIGVSVPLGGTEGGQVAARVSPQRLGEALLARSAPRGWTLSLVDEAGRIVWRSSEPERHVGRLATADLRRHATGEQGVWRGTNLEGEEVLAAYARSQYSGLRVAVGAPVELVGAPLRSSLKTLAALGVVALALSLLLGFFAARLIARPLRRLAEAGPTLGGTSNGFSIASRVREISELSRILDTASNEIASRSGALRESQSRLSQLLDLLPVAVVETGPSGEWSYANPAAEQLLRLSRSEVIGRPYDAPEWGISSPEGEPVDPRDLPSARALRGETVRGYEHAIQDPQTGQRRILSVNTVPVRSEEGEITGSIATLSDVTDRYKAEQALRQSGEEMRQITDALPVLISTVDREERYQFNNRAYEQWFGVDREANRGRLIRDVVGEENYARVKPHIDQALGGRRTAFEWEGVEPASGEQRYYRSEYIPRFSEDGAPDGFYVLFSDITEARRSQARLEELNQSLEAAVEARTRDLSAALIRLREEESERRRAEDALRQAQKMEAIGQLTGGVAHDFNNLLTVIRSSVDLLKKAQLTEERRQRYLGAIGQASDRAAALTSQLLAFARRQPMQPQVFDVGERLRNMLDLLRTTVGTHIPVALDLPDAPMLVETDPNQFEAAVLNLVVNARDALAANGRVDIKVSEATTDRGVRCASLSIADNGEGIPPEMLERIFEPFFTTKEQGKGTGLGLSQVYGFARQSSGEVTVESEVGKGTVFTLLLPITASAPAATPAAKAPRRHLEKRHVLVVEDNELVAELAKALLDELGYHATLAGDAAAALDLLARPAAAFDAVLSDIVMPGEMSGIDLAEHLRRTRPDLPVLLATGYSQVLATSGAHGFTVVSKPYSLEDLSQALDAVLGGNDAE